MSGEPKKEPTNEKEGTTDPAMEEQSAFPKSKYDCGISGQALRDYLKAFDEHREK